MDGMALKKSRADTSVEWKTVDSGVGPPTMKFGIPHFKPSELVAAFDLDHTLIVPRSGNKFPTNSSDWKWMSSEVVPKLTQLHAAGYTIVIFTNQGSTKSNVATEVATKIGNMSSSIGIPFVTCMSLAKDMWRKPSRGMWDFLVKKILNGRVDVDRSFYVGDAAGRPARYCKVSDAHRSADFACTDRKFAANCSLDFQTPEEFFHSCPAEPFNWGGWNPRQEMEKATDPRILVHHAQELVLCVGYPGCGKSTLTKRFMVPAGYKAVNQDTLGTKERCQAEAKRLLSSGSRVIIDNTNPSREGRAEYIKIARSHHVPVRCFRFKTSKAMAVHMNIFRERKKERTRVPEMAYRMFESRFEEPSISEGFAAVVPVTISPEFDNKDEERIFFEWTE